MRDVLISDVNALQRNDDNLAAALILAGYQPGSLWAVMSG
jgi:hypothetical protein